MALDPQAALSKLIAGAKSQLDGLSEAVFAEEIGPEAFGGRMAAMLEDWHGYAAYLGRYHAGDTAPYEADDKRFGQLIVSGEGGQIEFLSAFVSDLTEGRYGSAAAVKARANLYANRLIGTANETWTLTHGEATLFYWRLGSIEHCADCVTYAAGSPYKADTLPAYPGSGQSQCGTNCKCSLTTGSDQEGFSAD